MDSQKHTKRHRRHVGLDPASLYSQILLDSGLHRNDGKRTFCDVVKLAEGNMEIHYQTKGGTW